MGVCGLTASTACSLRSYACASNSGVALCGRVRQQHFAAVCGKHCMRGAAGGTRAHGGCKPCTLLRLPQGQVEGAALAKTQTRISFVVSVLIVAAERTRIAHGMAALHTVAAEQRCQVEGGMGVRLCSAS